MAETPVKEPPVEEAPAEEKTAVEEAPAEEAPVEAPPAKKEPQKSDKKSSSKKAVILLLLLLLLIGIGIGVYFAFFREEADDGRIPYEKGVVLFGDEDIEPVEAGWMKLTYNYKAFSPDGTHFTCLLANDPANFYDLYFDIYDSDRLAVEDRVFLSGLIPPGYGLKQIELTHPLPPGTTTCFVVFNQVDTDEEGNQTMVNQLMVTVEFVVNG